MKLNTIKEHVKIRKFYRSFNVCLNGEKFMTLEQEIKQLHDLMLQGKGSPEVMVRHYILIRKLEDANEAGNLRLVKK